MEKSTKLCIGVGRNLINFKTLKIVQMKNKNPGKYHFAIKVKINFMEKIKSKRFFLKYAICF